MKHIIFAAVCATVFVSCSTSGEKWTTFGGNNQRTGNTKNRAPATLTDIKWTFKTEGSVYLSPAVADGVVFFGSKDKRLYAVDAKTGQQKWRFETENVIISSPAVADGVVFFGSGDNRLYAVDAKTGQQKWRFKTEGEVSSSPAVADGVVFFGSYDNRLYAVE